MCFISKSSPLVLFNLFFLVLLLNFLNFLKQNYKYTQLILLSLQTSFRFAPFFVFALCFTQEDAVIVLVIDAQ